MGVYSDYAPSDDVDMYIFGGSVHFTIYYRGWGDVAVANHQYRSWHTLKAHARNYARTDMLRSNRPLEQPEFNFNCFEYSTTEGDADVPDLNALVRAVNEKHNIDNYNDYETLGSPKRTEMSRGPDMQLDEDLGQHVKDVAWGYHACCTAQTGNSTNPDTVLNFNFQVSGIQNLRIVDASMFPKSHGIFIRAPIMILSEKAADTILNS